MKTFIVKHFLLLFSLLISLVTAVAFGQQLSGSVSGTLVDRTGAAVNGALVKLTHPDHSSDQDALSDANGQFSFSTVVPGPYQLSVMAKGFAAKESSGTLAPGEVAALPAMTLELARVSTDVQVNGKQTELAEEQIKQAEKQRLLGMVPNYNVSYLHSAVPLNAKQKFEIAWKTTTDPVSFGIVGIIAGVQQWQNNYPGFGQGAEGYAKRYGASYAGFFTSNMISGALLPSIFKQDPRYFVKGNGSTAARFGYAIANVVICKGDSGHWQPKYAEILGNLASSEISNYYYPKADRNSMPKTFENAGIGLGAGALGNLFQEFLSKKLTPKAHH